MHLWQVKQKIAKAMLTLTLTVKKLKKFLHGEEIPVPKETKGYTAVAVNGIVTGFGKASNGTLKKQISKGIKEFII